LKREHTEFSQQALIYVFVRMGSKGYLRGRPDIADAIRLLVSSMKDQYTRESTEGYLNEIEKSTMK